MIARLRGTINHSGSNPAIVDVAGVGYKVFVPDQVFQHVRDGSDITLYIHTLVREDALDLYGFSRQTDLHLFELLLTVSGIGPKSALLVINRGSEAVRQAVASNDVDFFTAIPRLGKKNAQKIIIELKQKIGGIEGLPDGTATEATTMQIIEALEPLGFDRREILRTLADLPPMTGPIESRIRTVLQSFSKRKS